MEAFYGEVIVSERPRVPVRSSLHQSNRPIAANGVPSAVFIDGSALYMAARSLYEGRQLDYHALIRLLTSEISGVDKPGANSLTLWVMWTASAPQNAGQNRFLEFAENDLKWEVRRISPAESFIVEPSSLLDLSQSTRSRLVRFDASIAFAMGRLAEKRRLVVVSDSFALAQPLVLSHQVSGFGESKPSVFAFFGRALDPRVQTVLRKEPGAVTLVDFDDHEDQLFGSSRVEERRERTRDEIF